MTATAQRTPLLRLRDRRVLMLMAAAVAFLLVLVLRLWLGWVGPLPGDRWAEYHLGQVHLEQPWRDLGDFFSVIGGPPVASATVACALWFVARAGGVRAVAFVVLSCAGVGANAVLKALSGPTPLMVERFHSTDALNYPSGHTVYAVVLFGSLAVLAWLHRRRDASALLLGLILAMGPARVIADAHFVSDVVAGYLVGAGWLMCAIVVTSPGGGVAQNTDSCPPG